MDRVHPVLSKYRRHSAVSLFFLWTGQGRLWNRWEVLAMRINQSQTRMRPNPIFLQSQNHRKGTSPLILGPCRACVFAACLAGAREARLHPRIPHWRRVHPKHRASFYIFTPTNPPYSLVKVVWRLLHGNARLTEQNAAEDWVNRSN